LFEDTFIYILTYVKKQVNRRNVRVL